MPLLHEHTLEQNEQVLGNFNSSQTLREQSLADRTSILEVERQRLLQSPVERFVGPLEITNQAFQQNQEKQQSIAVDKDGNQMISTDEQGNLVATYENGDVCTFDAQGRIIRQVEPSEKESWTITWDGDRVVKAEGGSKNKQFTYNWNGQTYETMLNGKTIAPSSPLESGSNPSQVITMKDLHYEIPGELQEPIKMAETWELTDEKWKAFTDAIECNDADKLRAAFDAARPTPAAWQYLAERYEKETGKSFDEETLRILGQKGYATAKCDFTGGEFPFQDIMRMNRQLPTRDDELRARGMFPETADILNEGDISKVIANEVRFRERYDPDKPEKNYVGAKWNKGEQEDYADMLYNMGVLGNLYGSRKASIGPLQMQARLVDELQKEDSRLAKLNPTKSTDAPIFVGAYLDRNRRRFENDAQFEAWVASERELGHQGAAEVLPKLRQDYLDAKRRGDKQGMRVALITTYNPAVEGTPIDKVNSMERVYPNPYKRPENEVRHQKINPNEIQPFIP